MKRFLITLFAVCCAAGALASDRITATLTITNTPADALTLVVNSDTRTWKTTVATPASEIAVTNSIASSATNLWLHLVYYPLSRVTPRWLSTTQISLAGVTGDALTLTATDWGTVTYSTQAVTSLVGVRVPLASEPEAVRTNTATSLATGIAAYSQAPFAEYSVALQNLVGLTSTQTVSGPKTYTGAAVFGGGITTTNLVNYGDAISSPGTASGAEQIGTGAVASKQSALAVGRNSLASGDSSMALGNAAEATDVGSVAVGHAAGSTGLGSVALGSSSIVGGDGAIGVGMLSNANYDRSVAVGFGAATTQTNQIMLGISSASTRIPGALHVAGATTLASVSGTVVALTNGTYTAPTITGATLTGGTYSGTIGALTNGLLSNVGATNLTVTNLTVGIGTNTWSGQLAFARYDSTTLASGNNAGVDFGGSAVSVVINAGPSAAFAICGIAGGRDGRVLIVANATGYEMTVANESGVDAVPENRIITGSGADFVVAGYGSITLIYDSSPERWRIVGTTQAANVASLTVGGTLTASNVVYSGTYWDDAFAGALTLRTAASAPDLLALDTGSTTTNTVLYGFDASTEEMGYLTIQLPHRYKEGTDIRPHLHWCQTAAPSGSNTNVVWGIEYTLAAIGGTFAATTTTYATNGVSATNWKHQITSLPTITGAGLGISSVVNVRIFRAAASASDTYGSDAGFLGFDIHHEVDSPGSRSESAK